MQINKKIYCIAIGLLIVLCIALSVHLQANRQEIQSLNARITELEQQNKKQQQEHQEAMNQLWHYKNLYDKTQEKPMQEPPESEDMQNYTGGFLSLIEPVYRDATNHVIQGKKE